MRKMPKQPNQRLLAYLAADRQWPRHHRVAYARAQLAEERANKHPLQERIAFWIDVLLANGALLNVNQMHTSTRKAMGDHDWHTGPEPDISYAGYLHKEGYLK